MRKTDQTFELQMVPVTAGGVPSGFDTGGSVSISSSTELVLPAGSLTCQRHAPLHLFRKHVDLSSCHDGVGGTRRASTTAEFMTACSVCVLGFIRCEHPPSRPRVALPYQGFKMSGPWVLWYCGATLKRATLNGPRKNVRSVVVTNAPRAAFSNRQGSRNQVQQHA
jgi:hypothetical protein